MGFGELVDFLGLSPRLVSLFPLVAHGRPQLMTASGHPELESGVRLLARLGQPRKCSFSIDFLPFLMRHGG